MAEDRWEARQQAARAMLVSQKKHHEELARVAKVGVIYMDGCPAPENVHPAIGITEAVSFEVRKHEGIFHHAVAEKYQKAIEEIDALTKAEGE